MAAADDPVPAPGAAAGPGAQHRHADPGPVPPQGGPPTPEAPTRTRVVLAEVSQRQRPAAGTHTELTQQTRVGEALVRGLVRAQLALALQLSAVVLVGLGGLPLLFAIAPSVGRMTVLGVNLPWLVLGALSFPFLVAVGWTYVRLAERNEQDFTDLVQRPER